MEEPQRLTVASTWKFDPDGVDDIRARLKKVPKVGFCKYEAAEDVFAIDGNSSSIPNAAATLTRLLAAFIEDEKDNDLLEKPRVTRIVAPTAVDVDHDHGMDGDAENTLIEDNFYPPQTAMLPLAIKYWPEKGVGDVGCFTKFPCVLAGISEPTDVSAVLEKENRRIRVSSSQPKQVSKAMDKLNNLERSLSLVTSPQVANILNVDDAKEFRLRVAVYKALNDVALRRILVDRTSKITDRLSRMFSTSIEFVDPETQAYNLPPNVQKPPRMGEGRKGSSKLWADFKFEELGDSANLPDLPKVANPAKGVPHQDRNGASSKPPDTLQEQRDDYPYLSVEKASIVNQWRTGVDAGSGSESNNTPPPEPAVEPTEPPKGIAGLKKRRVATVGANVPATAPNPLAQQNSSTKTNGNNQHSKEATTTPVSIGGLNVRPDGNVLVHSASPRKATPKIRPGPTPTPREKGPSHELIDLSDPTPAAVPRSNMSLMSFSQAPLVPGRRQPPITEEPLNTIQETTSAKSFEQSTAQNGLSHKDSKNGVNGRVEEILKSPWNQPSATTHAPANTAQTRKDSDGQMPGSQFSQSPTVVEREHNAREINSRRFHRTMRQKTPSTQSKKSAKAKQKSERQAALAEAWGTPSLPNVNKSKTSTTPEPSEWKKKKMATDEQVHIDMVDDIFAYLEPILDATRCFTGTLYCEIQLGMILVHSPPSAYLDRMLNQKMWNSLFRPKHGVRPPSTAFFNRLTTSGTDIDYLFELTTEKDGATSMMFSEGPAVRTVQYELYCKTKTDDEIVICVDGSGQHVVNRPEALLGAINIHCPKNIWDMNVVVKGAQKYSSDPDEDFDKAVRTLIKSLYVVPNRTEVLLYFRIPDGGELTPLKVLMRRSTTHEYAQKLYGSNASQLAESGLEPNGTANAAQNFVRSPSAQGVYLKITEVQNLYMGTTTTDKTLYRARALESGKMVDDSRLWYEASIISPDIENILESNKDLELGASTTKWRPCNILGTERKEPEPASADKESSTAAYATKNLAPENIGTSTLGQMYRVANRVVDNIDVIGWANSGPGIDFPEGVVFPGSVTARSNFAAATSQGVASIALGRGRGMESSALRTVQNVGSISGYGAGGMQGDFW